ncbi:MAG: hypothetical protein HYY18_20300 [Planctomycetes bacterium]|nr:hypothetical protein [Planctomycetota bacterium]
MADERASGVENPDGFRLVRAALERVGGSEFRVKCQASEDGANWFTFQEFAFSATWPKRRKTAPDSKTGEKHEAC